MDLLYNNFLSDFFAWCLRSMDGLIGNYALTIVVLTIIIRLITLPLDLKQRSNQERMQELAPEMASLQKRYANDPVQLQRKTQELYRKMHVNPAMGCLPMLVSLPILFAFFGAMNLLASERTVGIMLSAAQYGPENVELPRFFWVHNFWQPDSGFATILPSSTEFLQFVQRNANYITPQTMELLRHQGLLTYADGMVGVNIDMYSTLVRQIIEANGVEYIRSDAGQMIAQYNNGWFILPALSGASLFLQQKFMTQNNMNAQQAATPEAAEMQGCTNKMMLWFFPLFSVYICCTSNTAFALYWFVSNIYAFTQMQVVKVLKKRKANRQPVPVQR